MDWKVKDNETYCDPVFYNVINEQEVWNVTKIKHLFCYWEVTVYVCNWNGNFSVERELKSLKSLEWNLYMKI